MAAGEQKLANPAALGLVGFGLTTVLLSLINAGVLPKAGENVVIPLAMAYGGTIQILAGLLEFRANNTFGMTAFLSYGAFWWWFALLLILGGNHVIPLDGTGTTIGTALILWGVLTMYLWVGTFRLTRLLWWIFLTLWIAFYLLGFGVLLGAAGLTQAGGWVGLVCGLLAMYGSFALVTNSVWGRDVLPVGARPMLN
jgi:succinate-acetate transporter protein